MADMGTIIALIKAFGVEGGEEDVSGSTPSISAQAGKRYICGEVSTLAVTLPAEGEISVVFASGTTPALLTVTPPAGKSIQWANGFDPTALNADTVYEISVLTAGNDCLGVAASWA